MSMTQSKEPASAEHVARPPKKRTRLFLVNVGRRKPIYPLATPPMGIMYLAAYLRERFDLEIVLINQREENLAVDEIIRQARGFDPDVIGFGAITTAVHDLAELTRKAREALPRALVLVGGPHVSAFREKVLEDTDAHVAVLGEGERTFEAILHARLGGDDFSEIPGLIWRAPDGEIVSNPGHTLMIEDLDTLPFPAYDLIDLRKYWKLQSMPPIVRRRYASLLSSRGCPYQCMWCHNIFGKRFRRHSPERIVEEIDRHIRTWGIDDVEFLDDIFNLDKKRVVEFCELAQRRNLKFKIAFPNAVRTDILTQDVVDALVDTGMYFSSFALEAGSPRVQEYTGKRLDIPKFLKGVEMAVDRGVFANGFVMLGFPTETEEDLRQTLDVAVNSRLHTASFFTVMPFPNTRLYDEVMRLHPERLAHVDYDNTDFASIRVNLSEVPDEVFFAYQRRANRRFFMKPSRILRIIRDYPQPLLLPGYLHIYLSRLTKGAFQRNGQL